MTRGVNTIILVSIISIYKYILKQTPSSMMHIVQNLFFTLNFKFSVLKVERFKFRLAANTFYQLAVLNFNFNLNFHYYNNLF